ncbi:glycosyltransferase [Baekduia soli]|uniref:Glycosyltransferase n=1 Tax=Baekduia soli TaxID=496014 RepID=A0A5B8U6N4_9ACTN|nr:glycosyltransferase [Baekduia soli]QEC48498.1 glycosyltransferase [Baekduia soli]
MTTTAAQPVSVLIPTIGRIPLLERCLESVLACDPPPDEIVVVDQSGAADVVDLLRRLGVTRLRRVACDGRGTAAAMNVGLGAVRHDTMLVTHDDCTVDRAWVGVGARLAAAAPGALITGRVLAPRDAEYVPSTKDDPVAREHTGEVTTGLLYPANMVASRVALVELGGFDERPGLLVAEDNDLCYRWLIAGRRLRYEPELVVWHHDWRTPDQLVRTHVAYARGQGAFYAKHLCAGDRQVLDMLRWDLRQGLRAMVRGRLSRTPRWQDPYREMVVWLLVGLVCGRSESRRLARAQSVAGRGGYPSRRSRR